MEDNERWCCNCKHANAAKDDCKYNLECRDFGLWEAMGADKFDTNKLPLGLIDKTALDGLAAVLQYGAGKYAAQNWRLGLQYSRVYDAALRHLTAFIDGEDCDPESGLPHVDHAMCCLMFLSNFSKKRKDLDDRYMEIAR